MRALLLLGLAACGGGSHVDAGPANAAIPQKYRAKLHFTSREVVPRSGQPARYELPVPDGWRMDPISDTLKPVDTTLFGSSAMDISRQCGSDPCKARDWDAYLDRSELAASATERNERSPGRRLATGRREDGMTFIFLAWWTDGADHFDRCEVLFDEHIQGAEDAFLKACQAVVERSP